jgi:hypothetical protein
MCIDGRRTEWFEEMLCKGKKNMLALWQFYPMKNFELLSVTLIILTTAVFCHQEYMVVQLVEAMHYKLEGCGFNSQWCHWNFSLA